MRFSLAIVALATAASAHRTYSCKYSDIADEQVELEGLYQSLDDASPWEKFWINREIRELTAELKKCGVKVDSDQPEGTTSTIGVSDRLRRRSAGIEARKPSCKYSDIADEQVELEGLYKDLEEADKPWEKFWINWQIKDLKYQLKQCGVKVDDDQPDGTTTTIGVSDKAKRGISLGGPLPKWLTDKFAECVARPHSNPMSAMWLSQAAEIAPSLAGGASTEFRIASRQSLGCGSADALEDYLFYLFAVYGSAPSPYQLALMQKAFEIIYSCGRDVAKWTSVVPGLTIPGGGSTTISGSGTSNTGGTTLTGSGTGTTGGTTLTGSSGGTSSSGSGTTTTGSGTTTTGSGTTTSGSGTTLTGSGGSSSGTTMTGSGSSTSGGSTLTGSGTNSSGTTLTGSSGSSGAVVPSGSTTGSGVRLTS